MMLSVMVVGARAAFSDQSKIKNTEAVDMCVALNIIGGYPDGSYKPEGNITRAEFAKMICVLLNGGTTPATATNTTPTFNDVRGNANAAWAEGFIEYCYAKGIVSGVGGGKFAPNGNVTATEAAKMLLVALGYNATVENYTGTSWALKVNVQANQDGLYKGLETIDTGAALTRDNAAQMVWNALQAYVIDKSSSIDRTDGSVTDIYTKSDSVDLIAKMYDGIIAKGELSAFEYNSKDAKWTYTVKLTDPRTVYGDNGDPITVSDYVKVVSKTDYTALLGQKVKAVYKYDKNAKENTVYGIFATDSEVVLSATVADLPKMTNSKDTSFKVGGTKYKLEGNLENTPVYQFTNTFGVDFIPEVKNEGTVTTAAVNTLWKLAGQTTSGEATVNVTAYDAQKFTAVDKDGNGKIDFFMVVPFTVAKVSYVGSDKFRLAGSSTDYNLDDVNAYKGIAKDDFVIFTAATNTADETDTFVKADKISGEVKKVDGSDIMVGDTWYTVDDSYGAISGGATKKKVTSAAAKLTDAVVVNGFVFYVDKADATSIEDFAVVIATESGGVSGSRAKLLFSNGDKTVVDTDKAYSKDTFPAGTLVTYSKNSDNEYILKVATKDDGSSYDHYNQGKTAATVTKISNGSDKAGYIDGAYVDDTSVIFIAYYKDKGSIASYKVITGAQLKKMDVIDFDSDFTDGYVLATKTSGSNHVDMAYVSTKSTIDINDADTYYGYVTAVADIQNGNKEEVRSVTVWTADGEKTYETAAKITTGADKIAKRSVIEYKLNADGKISQVMNAWSVDKTNAISYNGTDAAATVAITSLSPTLKVQLKNQTSALDNLNTAPPNTNGKDYMDLDSDTVYIYIENTDAKGMEKIDISTADDDANIKDARVPNAFIVVDKDGDVALVVYDVDNDITE